MHVKGVEVVLASAERVRGAEDGDVGLGDEGLGAVAPLGRPVAIALVKVVQGLVQAAQERDAVVLEPRALVGAVETYESVSQRLVHGSNSCHHMLLPVDPSADSTRNPAPRPSNTVLSRRLACNVPPIAFVPPRAQRTVLQHVRSVGVYGIRPGLDGAVRHTNRV